MKTVILLASLVMVLAGCANEYLITTTDGQMLSADGKPQLDEDTGMFEFRDAEGRKQQIPQASVKQIIER